jgi:alanyl aminopeptidase
MSSARAGLAARLCSLAILAALAACGPAARPTVVPTEVLGDLPAAGRIEGALDDAAPTGRLPADVRPTHYALALRIVPSEERFSGESRIDVTLASPRHVLWLHAQDMHVTEATITPEGSEPIALTVERAGDDGLAALRPARDVPAGRATIRIAYDAPFDRTLKGLYRVDSAGENYAFTQFEAISARYAFPCFDEPAFKTPFDVTLTVKREHVAIANTQPVEETAADEGMKRIRYATTLALPTYLLAFAVGPLDVVEAPAIPANAVRTRPLPFRGIAARGRGPELAYALEHTPRILAELEDYFGSEYPYDKLDILAVPDFASGAMENAGAITFREWLLLLNPQSAPEEQRRSFAGVMAHELAHQWFGNLVTMPWWDDIWLNEAFATWMGNRVVTRTNPEYQIGLSQLASIHNAMGQDALVSARRIRQPIDSNHDIRNAFDGITYSKGGGVLAMFERYLGAERFRTGIRAYMQAHRFGNATAEDLLAALGTAAGSDVATPFRTFLEQPGVPLVEASVGCEGASATLTVRQSRYLPVGSAGDRAQRWQIPLCVRFGRGSDAREQCTLVTEPEQRIALEGGFCPEWLMPNADGAGYYRFALPAADLARLRGAGAAQLQPRERLALADSLVAAFAANAIPAADVLAALAPLASDPTRAVATSPMGLVSFARDQMPDPALRPRIEAFARKLYATPFRRLGWSPRNGITEDGETKLLRKSVITFLAMVGRDPAVRAEAVRRARAYLGTSDEAPLVDSAVAPELVDVALAVAMEDGDAALFDRIEKRLRASTDANVRNRMLGALGGAHDPALGERALRLSLDPALRVNEVLTPLSGQMGIPEHRDATWAWVQAHYEPLSARIATTRAADLPWYMTRFCDAQHAASVEAFFGPRITALPGGPRNLAGSLEAIRLCGARLDAQGASLRTFFSSQRP